MAFGPAEVLGERYVLRKIEWTTPLGPMWSARDKVLDRPVLVQLLSGTAANDAAAKRAFQKAAARTAQATHPGVLQVFDIGDSPPFVVFEHAPGGRLSSRLAAGPMRTTEAARAAMALARALEALHERSAWHGSLSPDTVLFDGEGRPKLLATGLGDTARAAAGIDTAAEQPATYRPPEDSPLPADADRYALAALTYQMFTGRAPQRGVSARQQRRNVPSEIDTLLQRALSPIPAERPTLDEFMGALAPFVRLEPKAARGARMSTAEFRWLLPVALIVALGIAAATVGVSFVRDLANDGGKAPAPRVSAPVRDVPLKFTTVIDFDPQGQGQNPREESREDVPNATDGDPRTSWRTVQYREPDVGGKDGVGLLFELDEARTVRRIRVQSTLPGWKAEIRTGDEPPDRASDFTVVTTFEAQTESEIALPSGTRARFFLLWITALAEDPSAEGNMPFRAEIAEVEFFS